MRDGIKEYVADGCRPLDLTAFLRSDSLDAILGLCALSVGQDMPLCSRYDCFVALCRMMPMMDGHDEQARIRAILAKCFGIECDLSLQTADEVWKRGAEVLLFNSHIPTVTTDDIAHFYKTAPHSLPEASELPHLPSDLFLRDACSMDQWERALLAWADAYAPSGFCVTLDTDFGFHAPNPYHVRQAFDTQARTRAQTDMLLAQSLRILSPVLQKQGGELRILVHCCGEDATGLLSYLEKHVGLPRVTWTADADAARGQLLTFSLREHLALIRPVILLSTDCRSEELAGEIAAYARRFPVGLLSVMRDKRND